MGLATFTEEILNGKLQFLFSETILHLTFNPLTLFVVGSEYLLVLAGVGKLPIYLLKSLLVPILIFHTNCPMQKFLFSEKGLAFIACFSISHSLKFRG